MHSLTHSLTRRCSRAHCHAQELDDDEYEETRTDTLQQLEEFKTSLARMMAGDVTLVGELVGLRNRL